MLKFNVEVLKACDNEPKIKNIIFHQGQSFTKFYNCKLNESRTSSLIFTHLSEGKW